jgi:hypothetical protein
MLSNINVLSFPQTEELKNQIHDWGKAKANVKALVVPAWCPRECGLNSVRPRDM